MFLRKGSRLLRRFAREIAVSIELFGSRFFLGTASVRSRERKLGGGEKKRKNGRRSVDEIRPTGERSG